MITKYKEYFIGKDKQLGYSCYEKTGDVWMCSVSSFEKAKEIIDQIVDCTRQKVIDEYIIVKQEDQGKLNL